MKTTTVNTQALGRAALIAWEKESQRNIYSSDPDFKHTIAFGFEKETYPQLNAELTLYGEAVAMHLEPLVAENNLDRNLPYIKRCDALGNQIDEIIHHPSYVDAGNIIYGSGLLAKLSQPGQLSECLALLFLSSQTGEAGHHCPIACSAGIIRVLNHIEEAPHREYFLKKLMTPSFANNYTGAQFLTEIQGGSDVGQNRVRATHKEKNVWRIKGEKWFCSNANAELMLVMARYSDDLIGTKGLSLFMVPARWEGKKNHYHIRRLKNKLGTRTLATGEIEFEGAYAWSLGNLEQGFHLAMNLVLHTSRLFNSVCVIGMARRAYHLAYEYAKARIAFGQPILNFMPVSENLAMIKSENSALIAMTFAVAHLQDQYDIGVRENANDHQSEALLLRTLVNLLKYFTAKRSVDNIHHALDVLAGNGTIEDFSPLPRLLRDCIICENWEGTHNVIGAQILKDMKKYSVHELILNHLRSMLKAIPVGTIQAEFNQVIDRLTQATERFLTNDSALQALNILAMIDEFAYVYSALCLYLEAHDQTKQGIYSKHYCFQYYFNRHVKKAQQQDAAYLALIKNIVS